MIKSLIQQIYLSTAPQNVVYVIWCMMVGDLGFMLLTIFFWKTSERPPYFSAIYTKRLWTKISHLPSWSFVFSHFGPFNAQNGPKRCHFDAKKGVILGFKTMSLRFRNPMRENKRLEGVKWEKFSDMSVLCKSLEGGGGFLKFPLIFFLSYG